MVAEQSRVVPSASQFSKDVSCQLLVDFTVSGDRLTHVRAGILIPVMSAAMMDKDTSHAFDFPHEVMALHPSRSSAT
jgi:hypothetical protein